MFQSLIVIAINFLFTSSFGQVINFDGTDVQGRLFGPQGVNSELLSALKSDTHCFDNNLRPELDERPGESGENFYHRLEEAYRRTLMCLHDCMTEDDARFVMSCDGSDQAIRAVSNHRDPIALSRSGEILRSGGSGSSAALGGSFGRYLHGAPCSERQLIDGAIRGEFHGHYRDPDTHQCTSIAHPDLHPRMASMGYLRGIDFVIMLDNSGSMSTRGRRVVRESLPRLAEAAASLPFETRVILFSQTADAGSVVLSTRDPDFKLKLRRFSNHLYAVRGDPHEADMDAVVRVARATVRPDADLFVLILTDEDDHYSELKGRRFVQSLNDLTRGRVSITLALDPREVNNEPNTRDPSPEELRTNYANLSEMLRIAHGTRIDLTPEGLNSGLTSRLDELTQPRGDVTLRVSEPADFVLSDVRVNGRIISSRHFKFDRQDHTLTFDEGGLNPRRSSQIEFRFIAEQERALLEELREGVARFMSPNDLTIGADHIARDPVYTVEQFQNIVQLLSRIHDSEAKREDLITGVSQLTVRQIDLIVGELLPRDKERLAQILKGNPEWAPLHELFQIGKNFSRIRFDQSESLRSCLARERRAVARINQLRAALNPELSESTLAQGLIEYAERQVSNSILVCPIERRVK